MDDGFWALLPGFGLDFSVRWSVSEEGAVLAEMPVRSSELPVRPP